MDWRSARLVAVRSTWDYQHRRREFLDWAERVGPGLLHGARTFAWNTDKAYLVELAATGLPVVPTSVVDDRRQLREALAAHGRCVLKPRVGAGGDGVVVVTGPEDAPDPVPRGSLAQPLVDSVRTEGETSVFVLDGRAVSQVHKLPAPGEIRVHEEYGGSTRPVPLTAEAAELAVAAVAAGAGVLDADLVYARIDLMRHDGEPVVSEVEITEPGLYLDVLPDNAGPFADAVARRL